MTFTKEQLEELSKYEDRFHTAIYAQYARNLGSGVLDRIKEIYDTATKGNYAKNWGCSHCVLNFLRTVGVLYFKDKEAQKESEPSKEENNNKDPELLMTAAQLRAAKARAVKATKKSKE